MLGTPLAPISGAQATVDTAGWRPRSARRTIEGCPLSLVSVRQVEVSFAWHRHNVIGTHSCDGLVCCLSSPGWTAPCLAPEGGLAAFTDLDDLRADCTQPPRPVNRDRRRQRPARSFGADRSRGGPKCRTSTGCHLWRITSHVRTSGSPAMPRAITRGVCNGVRERPTSWSAIALVGPAGRRPNRNRVEGVPSSTASTPKQAAATGTSRRCSHNSECFPAERGRPGRPRPDRPAT